MISLQSTFVVALSGTALLSLTMGQLAKACTGGALTAADGSVVVGRTLEFGKPLDSQIAVWPAGSKFVGSSNRGQGLSYRSRHGFVGATVAQYSDMILDGLNEKGLNVGLFYFPGFAQYTTDAKARPARTLAPAQLGTWLLTNFATVEEVRAGLNNVDVTAQVISLLGEVPDVHFKVQDASGKSIVIEPREGRLLVHDNPSRVLTNSPTFPWHITNLTNYLTTSSAYPAPLTLGAPGAGQTKLTPFGMGAGGFGLPGDFSPPSRFVRMVFLTHNAKQTPNSRAAVSSLFHILNNFDIPLGAAQPPAGTAESNPDFTTWTSVSNLRDLTFNWKTFGDQQVKTLSLRQALDAANGQLKLLPMGPQQPDAVSPTLEVRVN
jgi:choloylglycine hydrolase